MKTLNVHFTDAEYDKMIKAKRHSTYHAHSWHDFILYRCSNGYSLHKKLKSK